jgi:hypothetical protein
VSAKQLNVASVERNFTESFKLQLSSDGAFSAKPGMRLFKTTKVAKLTLSCVNYESYWSRDGATYDHSNAARGLDIHIHFHPTLEIQLISPLNAVKGLLEYFDVELFLLKVSFEKSADILLCLR